MTKSPILKYYRYYLIVFFISINILKAQTVPTAPTFGTGEDPKPSGEQWELVTGLSDEFDGTELDDTKWENTRPDLWIGRAPGLFTEESATVSGGDLRLENYLLDAPQVLNGETYTHGCGNIWSIERADVGYYTEAKMRANKTFLSSTFWLINRTGDFTGCDKRTTELDIVEVVGEVTGTGANFQDFDQSMHSNSHSRNTSCPETPTGSQGGDSPTSGKVWADYHIYGCWWKSATELIFFLDGEEVHSITPKADFSLEMYLRLVTETYNWNPVPNDGQQGMGGTLEERTTYYDWVRTWKLAPESESVMISNSPTSVEVGESFDVEVAYEANSDADIVVALYDPTGTTFYKNAKKTVMAGSGNVTITLSTQTDPAIPVGNDYDLRAILRDVNGNFSTNRETTNTTIDLVQNSLSLGNVVSGSINTPVYYPNPVEDGIVNFNTQVVSDKSIVSIYDLKGNLVLKTDLDSLNNTISVETLSPSVYILKVEGGDNRLLDKLVVR